MKYIITEEQRGNIRDFLINKIEDGELIEAAKLMGGYDTLRTILGDYEIDNKDKSINIMKYIDKVGKQVIKPENQIVISKSKKDLKLKNIRRIYQLNKFRVSVLIDKNGWYHDDYDIVYGSLDGDILDEIISVLVDNKTRESY